MEQFILPIFDNNYGTGFDFIPIGTVRTINADGIQLIVIPGKVLQMIAEEAFARLSFSFSQEHLDALINISKDPAASSNDKLIAAYLLKNAETAAQGIFPLCQDTGIATVFGWRGRKVLVDSAGHTDEQWLEKGIQNIYRSRNLRFSTNLPETMFVEKDPGTNLPAQIELYSGGTSATSGDDIFSFIFTAKGGGSSNKSVFIQGTKAILNPDDFTLLLKKHIAALGTSACPPYSIAVVVGGLSPEQNLTALKLATTGAFEACKPAVYSEQNSNSALLFRDAYWEQKVMEIAADTGFGAQFGGKYLAMQATVLRLPRHGASCPISIGVSCSAHRNLRGFIGRDGIYLQKTVTSPALLPGFSEAVSILSADQATVSIPLDDGMDATLRRLAELKPGTFATLTGHILVARDKAHARWKQQLENTGHLPEYTMRYPICYAGPAQTPDGKVIGSFGPTTAGRMDSYADMLMSRGASLVSIAKGNRGQSVADACKKYGGFYLGTPGGTAALIAKEYITSAEILDYPEFGMEAVRLVAVKNLPVCVLIDCTGKDFYQSL